jgi:hypothetical protein
MKPSEIKQAGFYWALNPIWQLGWEPVEVRAGNGDKCLMVMGTEEFVDIYQFREFVGPFTKEQWDQINPIVQDPPAEVLIDRFLWFLAGFTFCCLIVGIFFFTGVF